MHQCIGLGKAIEWVCKIAGYTRCMKSNSPMLVLEENTVEFEKQDCPFYTKETHAKDLVRIVDELVKREFSMHDAKGVRFEDERFISDATKVARDFISIHAVLVLGQTGSGKSSLINNLVCDPEARHAGRYIRDATKSAAAVDMKLPDFDDSATVLLVDTEGWTYETRVGIREQYQKILRDKSLACEHTPHVVLFCVQVTSFKSFKKDELKKMNHEFKSLKSARRFPIAVLPVATFADTVPEGELHDVTRSVFELAEQAFEDTGAKVMKACATACKPGEGTVGVDKLRRLLASTMQDQIASEDFRQVWWLALASALQRHAKGLLSSRPGVWTEWVLFEAAMNVMIGVCGKAMRSKPEPSKEKLPPWWVIEEIPRVTQKQNNEVYWFPPPLAYRQAIWRELTSPTNLVKLVVSIVVIVACMYQMASSNQSTLELQTEVTSLNKSIGNLLMPQCVGLSQISDVSSISACRNYCVKTVNCSFWQFKSSDGCWLFSQVGTWNAGVVPRKL